MQRARGKRQHKRSAVRKSILRARARAMARAMARAQPHGLRWRQGDASGGLLGIQRGELYIIYGLNQS